MWISDKQRMAMNIVGELVNEFGADRWFVQAELPGITLHSIDALVNKGYLETKDSNCTMISYYRRLKELEE